MKHQMVIGISLIMLLLASCAPLKTTPTNPIIAPTNTIIIPTKIPHADTSGVKLLFVYSSECTQCENQIPILVEYGEKNPEIEVTLVKYSDLDFKQEKLISGFSGDPIILFYLGQQMRRIIGEVSLNNLEEEYESFIDQLSGFVIPTIPTEGCG